MFSMGTTGITEPHIQGKVLSLGHEMYFHLCITLKISMTLDI